MLEHPPLPDQAKLCKEVQHGYLRKYAPFNSVTYADTTVNNVSQALLTAHREILGSQQRWCAVVPLPC